MDKKTADRLENIKQHPEDHHHDYDRLLSCCMVDGALDTLLMQAHQDYAPIGYNGGKACDTTDGPCSCGAWH
jgi:hypothetical protein